MRMWKVPRTWSLQPAPTLFRKIDRDERRHQNMVSVDLNQGSARNIRGLMTISRAQRGHRLRHRSSRNVASDAAPWLLLARRGSRRICVDLVAASALVCISVLASLPLALALHPGTAGPRHGSSPALTTLTPRPLSSACRARFMCSARLCSVLGAACR